MAWSSGNTYFDSLRMPDGYDWTIREFNHSQFAPGVYKIIYLYTDGADYSNCSSKGRSSSIYPYQTVSHCIRCT
ncbi:hypothetical protein PDIG_44470 [Penicillium digitatum PHI26]|uniref:Uncharacterized protein n=2 Tax=Penicillium digitatum TaxID=36651 RepID=K9GCD8_PEND2|nr:hypothetical protein PDIP_35710 [Penicillium digitatum Pd1]EKV12523.1 hypothetical protein PDIG_44470 [Penicillium digitatum PHI26]EKV16460.1 hypothetical protein PDIP_35710 [Penicillium digitatum Pd1]